jgi:hypothetical protein
VIVAIAWAVAAAIAVVVAGFCAYEIRWKLTRLRADLAALTVTLDETNVLGDQLRAAAERASALTATR